MCSARPLVRAPALLARSRAPYRRVRRPLDTVLNNLAARTSGRVQRYQVTGRVSRLPHGTGAVLSFGKDWASARPVTFKSKQLSPAEKNYPTHDKELLAIVRALHKWRNDLLGAEFEVFTDHRTLEFLNKQQNLSKKQLQWQEFLADFNFSIKYIGGEDNTVADALSQQFSSDAPSVVAPVLTVSTDSELLHSIKTGYKDDLWCSKLLVDGIKVAGVSKRSGLLFVADRLVIPHIASFCESIFRLAHDSLGHFGAMKSYEALCDSFYWPNMRRDLERAYIPGCVECQRNKALTSKPASLLHSLPVPDDCLQDIALDFMGPLPPDEGFNYLLTITDRLGADIRLIPCRKDVTAERVAALFFDHWHCENGLPRTITSDRDKLFVSRFWSALHELTGVKLRLSSSFHPETDGSSERTNKTVIQCLRFYVDRHQKGWVFHLLCYVSVSPCVMPPMVESPPSDVPIAAVDIVSRLTDLTAEAKDNLLAAKISQTIQVNAHRRPDQEFAIVVRANPEKSSYTLNMPNAENIFPTFHSSLLRPFVENDGNLFPSRNLERPAAVAGDSGDDEYFVDEIIDEKRGRRGMEYLVSFRGYGDKENCWLPRREVEELEALDRWLASWPNVDGAVLRRRRTKKTKILAATVLSFLECLPDDIVFTWDSSTPFL
ncbi:hypothetical protein CCMSSC00406_0008474 [Pleurotus cornucopiae]|uniref:Uncharacterized protein n=1 Tax=Pleurotus cornucopiae TaxID=5321 RepID=A0ACB7IGT9_PLECO|nr:hypothetical protein CCMSSC00406_0008474 [Pleurotus cornucopiae]